MNQYVKKIIYSVLIVIALGILVNWMYFRAQIEYYLNPPAESFTEETHQTQATGEPNRLVIESLGISAPVVYQDEVTENAFQVALRSGVVHYPGTPKPGEAGNVYIFGHSSDFPTSKGDYKTVFALLPKIKTGAIIELSDDAGKIYRYSVAETKVVNPDDIHVLDQDESKHQLSVQTSYPVGTALRRFIVISYLIEDQAN